jgi:hypothetical protein
MYTESIIYSNLLNQPRSRNVMPDAESKETKLVILSLDLEKIGKI